MKQPPWDEEKEPILQAIAQSIKNGKSKKDFKRVQQWMKEVSRVYTMLKQAKDNNHKKICRDLNNRLLQMSTLESFEAWVK